MEIADRKLWEQELTDHMRRHAGDLHNSSVTVAKPGLRLSAPMLALWTVLVMVLTSVGWVIGLYFI